jgi:hypothetical protein
MVYQWGILTHGKVEKLDLPLQDDEKVRDISCGGYHCLALTCTYLTSSFALANVAHVNGFFFCLDSGE